MIRHFFYLTLFLVPLIGQAEKLGYKVKPLPELPALSQHCVVELNGMLYIFGGQNSDAVYTRNLKDGKFVKLNVRRELVHAKGAAIDDRFILVVNGSDDCLFDTRTSTFVDLDASLNKGAKLTGFQLVKTDHGRIIVSGGHNGETPRAEVQAFDPKTRTFTVIGEMSEARGEHGACVIDNDTILICGGIGPSRKQGIASIELFSLASGKSVFSFEMAQARAEVATIRLPNGTIFIAGGYTPKVMMNALDTTFLFNPKTRGIAQGPRMGIARYRPQLRLLSSGRVGIFGGAPDARLVEVFDHKDKSLHPANQLLIEPHASGFTVNALPDGILVWGGRPNQHYTKSPGGELFVEETVKPKKEEKNPLAALIVQLGDSDFRQRDEAMHKLSGKGQAVRRLLYANCRHKNPEIRWRVNRLLEDLASTQADSPWSFEAYAGDRVIYREQSKSLLAGLSAHWLEGWAKKFEQSKITRLKVTFPPETKSQIKGSLLNRIGCSRVPTIEIN